MSAEALASRLGHELDLHAYHYDGARVVGTGTFFRVLKSLILSRVDTPEERESIVRLVMSVADAFVAAKYGPAWVVFRPVVEQAVRALLEGVGS